MSTKVASRPTVSSKDRPRVYSRLETEMLASVTLMAEHAETAKAAVEQWMHGSYRPEESDVSGYLEAMKELNDLVWEATCNLSKLHGYAK